MQTVPKGPAGASTRGRKLPFFNAYMLGDLEVQCLLSRGHLLSRVHVP